MPPKYDVHGPEADPDIDPEDQKARDARQDSQYPVDSEPHPPDDVTTTWAEAAENVPPQAPPPPRGSEAAPTPAPPQDPGTGHTLPATTYGESTSSNVIHTGEAANRQPGDRPPGILVNTTNTTAQRRRSSAPISPGTALSDQPSTGMTERQRQKSAVVENTIMNRGSLQTPAGEGWPYPDVLTHDWAYGPPTEPGQKKEKKVSFTSWTKTAFEFQKVSQSVDRSPSRPRRPVSDSESDSETDSSSGSSSGDEMAS